MDDQAEEFMRRSAERLTKINQIPLSPWAKGWLQGWMGNGLAVSRFNLWLSVAMVVMLGFNGLDTILKTFMLGEWYWSVLAGLNIALIIMWAVVIFPAARRTRMYCDPSFLDKGLTRAQMKDLKKMQGKLTGEVTDAELLYVLEGTRSLPVDKQVSLLLTLYDIRPRVKLDVPEDEGEWVQHIADTFNKR